MLKGLVVGLVLVGSLSTRASAQVDRPFSFEARAIAMTPTFGIADDDRVGADVGPGFGVGLGYRVSPRVRLMADFDAGYHGSEIGDVNTYHYLGKIGFDAVNRGRVTVTLNAGAGMMSIAPKGADRLNYFAINAGAKIGIALSSAAELLISPQGDIAFTKTDEVLTKAAWIWPVGVGLRLRF